MIVVFSRLLSRLSANTFLVAICNVCIMALPLSLIATFAELIALAASHWQWDSLAIMMGYVAQTASLLFPILLNIYLSTYLSRIWHLPKSAMIASGLTAFLVISQQWHLIANNLPLPNNFAFALLSSYLIGQVMAWLKPIDFFRLDKSHNIIDNSLGVLSVSILSVFVLILGGYLSKGLFGWLFQSWQFPDLDLTSFQDGLLYELFRQISWAVGINGHNVFQVLKADLHTTTLFNLSDHQNFGIPINIINTNFYDFFTGIGGSGNTLALVVCLLFLAKDKRQKLLAKTALVLALFNINEPIIYGLPIIFNIVLLIPFILTPLVCFCVAYFAFSMGWIPPLVSVHSWLLPPFLSGYAATGGAWQGTLLQVILLFISMLLYYPFVRSMNQRTEQFQFIQLFNERFFGGDEIEIRTKLTSHIPTLHENFVAQRTLEKLQHEGEMMLFYQPQVCVKTKKIKSLEVLLRYQNKQGDIQSPSFLSAFQKLNLMPELDFWVLNKALSQTQWAHKNHDFQLSVNVSPQTLILDCFVETLDKLLMRHQYPAEKLELELTEDVLCQDKKRIQDIIDRLRERGIGVALDDFGSGYSSLSYLTELDFHKIKLDRSLVLNLNSEKGRALFQLAVQLGQITHSVLVVEGVEHQEEFEFIFDQGVELIQGYYFYHPMPWKRILPLLVEKQIEPKSQSAIVSIY